MTRADARQPITHVAIRWHGKLWSLPAPNRHHDVVRLICSETGAEHVDAHDDDQGFLDSSGRYLTRRQALASARLNGQIKRETAPQHGLFSEDVW